MKKLQIPIEQELMTAAKHLALKKGVSLKDLVTSLIKEAVKND